MIPNPNDRRRKYLLLPAEIAEALVTAAFNVALGRGDWAVSLPAYDLPEDVVIVEASPTYDDKVWAIVVWSASFPEYKTGDTIPIIHPGAGSRQVRIIRGGNLTFKDTITQPVPDYGVSDLRQSMSAHMDNAKAVKDATEPNRAVDVAGEPIPEYPSVRRREKIPISGKPTKLEGDFKLEAVGQDFNGEVKPIAELSHNFPGTLTYDEALRVAIAQAAKAAGVDPDTLSPMNPEAAKHVKPEGGIIPIIDRKTGKPIPWNEATKRALSEPGVFDHKGRNLCDPAKLAEHNAERVANGLAPLTVNGNPDTLFKPAGIPGGFYVDPPGQVVAPLTPDEEDDKADEPTEVVDVQAPPHDTRTNAERLIAAGMCPRGCGAMDKLSAVGLDCPKCRFRWAGPIAPGEHDIPADLEVETKPKKPRA